MNLGRTCGINIHWNMITVWLAAWFQDDPTCIFGRHQLFSNTASGTLMCLLNFFLCDEYMNLHSKPWFPQQIPCALCYQAYYWCVCGVPSHWDLMPDDLSCNWYNNNNRNKVHNKCNAHESSWNHLPLIPGLWTNFLPQNWSLVSKKVGDCWDYLLIQTEEGTVFLFTSASWVL